MLTEEDFENAEAAVKAVSDAYKKNNRLSLLNDAEKTLYEFAKKVLAEARRDFLTETRSNSFVIPEGWQLVPKEPTQGMCDAGIRRASDIMWSPDITDDYRMRVGYKAMLSAAPEPQDERE